MSINQSLESLLATLSNAPEPEKKDVFFSILKALREACGLFNNPVYSDYQDAARAIQKILDGILANEVSDEEWEEEFVESGTHEEVELSETFVSTRPAVSVVQVEESNSPESKINRIISQWNSSNDSWLKMAPVSLKDSNSVIFFVRSTAATYSNIASNTFDNQSEVLNRFEQTWRLILEAFKETDYKVNPVNFNDTSAKPGDKVIYACRSRVAETEYELVSPGVWFQNNLLQSPVRVIAVSMDGEYPGHLATASLPSHWRGILGELDVFCEHLEMQIGAYCALEGINKNKVEPLEEYRSAIIAEVKRRAEVLQSTVQKKEESIYRVATDYWRVEECFWSVFHDDSRPTSCSYFDRLRTRLQSWRANLRRILKFQIRDFACGSDSLASVKQYVGNMILQPKPNTAQGIVIRELRPAIVVKDQAANRFLKGRVVAT